MAAPHPFPEEEDIKNSAKMLNIEHQLEESLRTRKNLYKDMDGFRKDVQASAEKHLEEERRAFLLLQEKTTEYYEETKKGLLINGDIERKQHYEDLQSIQNEIDNNTELIKIHSQMRSIEADMAKKVMDENNKWFNFVSNQLQDVFRLKVNEYELTKKIGKQIFDNGVETKLVAYTLGAVVMMLKGGFELFKKMDTAAWEFRKAMGMTRAESAVIRKDAERLAIDYMAMGVTIDQVYKSYQSIGQAVGGVHNVTKDMARDVALMNSQLGISEELSVGFLQNLAAISGTTMESKTNMLGFAQAISSAAGVPLDQVMKDVSSKSYLLFTNLHKSPAEIIKASVELQRLGSSFDIASNSAESLMDFTNNIKDQMDASVLLGRSLNLQRAAQLAYDGDLVGSQKEMVKQAQQLGFTTKMDYFQRKATAQAMGMRVDQLFKMVQSSEQIEQIRRQGTPRQKAELAAYEKMRKENEASAIAKGKDAMYQIRTEANQQRLVQIQNNWNEILAKAQQFLLPAINVILLSINWILGLIANNFKISATIAAGLWLSMKMGFITTTKIGKVIEGWGEKLFYFSSGKNWKWLETIGDWINKLGRGFSGLGSSARSLTAKIAGLIERLPFGKIITRAASSIGRFFGGIATRMGGLFEHIPFGKFVSQVISSIRNLFGGIATRFGGLFGGITSRLGAVLKFAGRWVIPLMFAWNIFTRIRNLLHDPTLMGTKGFLAFNGKLIIKAFGVIIGALWDTFNDLAFGLPKLIVKGFVWVGKELWGVVSGWAKSIWTGLKDFIGFSPSVLGKRIVTGISSVGGMIFNSLVSPFLRVFKMISPLFSIGSLILKGITAAGPVLFNALTRPFKMLMSWVDKIPLVGGLLNKMGIGSKAPSPTIQKSVEHKVKAAYIPAVTVTPTGTKIETPSANKSATKPKAEEKGATTDDLYKQNDQIIKLLTTIAAKDTNIKLDGSLVSTQLARGIAFKGSFGTNR